MRLTHSENISYYAVLKLDPADLGSLKRNYFKLSRLVHPDKCQHPDAGRAMALVSTAYDVLSTPMKKKLYDAYATQEKPEDMSFAEWESKQVAIPAWVASVLRIPGGGCCLCLILTPLVITLGIFSLVFWILCLPVNCVFRCFGVRRGSGSTAGDKPPADGVNQSNQQADDNV